MKKGNIDLQHGNTHGRRLPDRYRGMETHKARTLAIKEASGHCWWIETFLRHNTPELNKDGEKRR